MMRQYRRPFLLLNMLFVLMTFSGKFAIGFYAVEVFHDASSGLNEYFSAIVVGKCRTFTAVHQYVITVTQYVVTVIPKGIGKGVIISD